MGEQVDMEIRLNNLKKIYDNNGILTEVFENLSLHVNSGAFVSILGPSGCGKSTLLKIVGGFESGGKPCTDIFMIFQDFNQLFPWRTLGDNLYYAIRKTNKGLSKTQAKEKAESALAEVGLSGFYDHYPHQLSGGMKQRGALARALAVDCKVLLLDEPFSSLDKENKDIAHALLLKIWKERQLTVLFVTHDLEEAKALSQEIFYLADLDEKNGTSK